MLAELCVSLCLFLFFKMVSCFSAGACVTIGSKSLKTAVLATTQWQNCIFTKPIYKYIYIVYLMYLHISNIFWPIFCVCFNLQVSKNLCNLMRFGSKLNSLNKECNVLTLRINITLLAIFLSWAIFFTSRLRDFATKSS